MRRNLKLIFGDSSKKDFPDEKNKSISKESKILKDILSKASDITDQTIVIKFPSEVIVNDDLLENYIQNCSYLINLGASLIIIHEAVTPETLEDLDVYADIKLDITKHNNSNLVMEFVQCGIVARRIISYLSNAGISAVNIAAKDSEMIRAKKTRRPYIKNTGVLDVNFSGRPEILDPSILFAFHDSGIVPVISPIAVGENGNNFFLNADYTSSIISVGMGAMHLVIPSSDAPFVMEDGTILGDCTIREFTNLHKKYESSLEILQAGVMAINDGVLTVSYVNTSEEDGILKAIFSSESVTRLNLL